MRVRVSSQSNSLGTNRRGRSSHDSSMGSVLVSRSVSLSEQDTSPMDVSNDASQCGERSRARGILLSPLHLAFLAHPGSVSLVDASQPALQVVSTRNVHVHGGLPPRHLSLSTFLTDQAMVSGAYMSFSSALRMRVPNARMLLTNEVAFCRPSDEGGESISRSLSCPHWMGRRALTNASLTEWIPEAT